MLFYYPWGAYTERHNAFAMKLQKIVIKLTIDELYENEIKLVQTIFGFYHRSRTIMAQI